jgi:hypothetical protein
MFLSFRLHTIEQPAANIINQNITRRRVHFSIQNICSGMLGTRVCREKKVAMIDGSPNNSAVFHTISPDLSLRRAHTRAVNPTIMRL